MKLIADYGSGYNMTGGDDPLSADSLDTPVAEKKRHLNIGLVIPQSSLRDTIKKSLDL